MRSTVPISALAALVVAGCAPPEEPAPQYRMTIDELLLRDARTCSSGFEYPSVLVDGVGTQLVEELRCLDDAWLEFYTPCREAGCIWADGPQPHAIRPEVIDALGTAAASADDFISITAGYRDVAMQYYSRWYNENCDASFDAAIPGQSNHQGGRAVDVRYYDYWSDILLAHGFEHPIPTDRPHFELIGTAAFRDESAQLQELSVLAFQRLWNRNNPSDRIAEHGVYDAETKDRLGDAPVEGFPIGACPAGSGGEDVDVGVDTGLDATSDTGGSDTVGTDTGSTPDTGRDTEPDAGDAGLPDGDAASDAAETDTVVDTGFGPGTGRPVPALYSIATDGDVVSTRGCVSARSTGGPPTGALLAAAALALRRRRNA